MKLRSGRLRTAFTVAALVVVAGLAAVALDRALHGISYRTVVDTLRVLPAGAIAASMLATVLSFVVLLANDLAALRYARATPPPRTIAFASFCGYALGNAIGFGALSGGAVRYRIYSAAGLSAVKVARVALFIATAFGTGAAATIAAGLMIRGGEIAKLFGVPASSLHIIAGLVLAIGAAGLGVCALVREPVRVGPLAIDLPSPVLALIQLGVTGVDVTVSAAALWLLLPASGVDFPAFVVIYAAAVGLGVVSHVPGGIGVFDAVVLYAVGATADPSAVAAALLAYRAIYFGLPFAFAVALLTCAEIRRSLRRA